MSVDRQKAALNPFKTILILGSLSAVQVSQDGQEQPMSWGWQKNQGQVVFYPCQLYQLFLLAVVLLMASVKEMNGLPSLCKESYRFSRWTEICWALLCDLQCSAAHLGGVCTLPDSQSSLHWSPWVQRFIYWGNWASARRRPCLYLNCKLKCGKVM